MGLHDNTRQVHNRWGVTHSKAQSGNEIPSERCGHNSWPYSPTRGEGMGPWPKTFYCTFYARISLAKLLDGLPIKFQVVNSYYPRAMYYFLISVKIYLNIAFDGFIDFKNILYHLQNCDGAGRNASLDAEMSPQYCLVPRTWGQFISSATFNPDPTSHSSYHHYILILTSYEADRFEDKAEVKSLLVSTQNDTRALSRAAPAYEPVPGRP